MSATPRFVFLPGLGETRTVWDPVAKRLPHADCSSLDVVETTPPLERWSLEGASRQVADTLTEPVHVVGLSLGAVVALQIAIRHPDKVASLFISAPQAKPPRVLMSLQTMLMRVLPEKWICPPGLRKPGLLAVLDSMKHLDLTSQLSNLRIPVTVACGSKDRANLPAARNIARLIPSATLEIVQGVGHRWHATHPELFALQLTKHIAA